MTVEFLKESYSGKKVFVTGHTGFKGAWLVTMLHQLGAIVKGYSLSPENPLNLFDAINGTEICSSVIGNILNATEIRKEITAFEPDYVFHLAAQPLVRKSYDIPALTFETNVIGTANLLDAINWLSKPCATVIITTDKVYENREWEYPYRENDNLGGYDPYSASKACAEILVNSYRQSFFSQKEGHGLATARAGNVIGGGDWSPDRIVPDIIRALQKSEPVIIRNPLSIRPWQHVLEPLTGYLLLGAKLKGNISAFSEAFNFGPYADDNLSVKQLVEKAMLAWGSGEFKIVKGDNQPHEAGILKLDISKANTQLMWQPKLNSGEAISLTVEWYKAAEKANVRQLCVNQITNYWEK